MKHLSQYYVTSRKVAGSRPDEALGFTQPLTEMNTRSRKVIFLGSTVQPVTTAIYELIV
jgi:hypothetical protein